MLEILQNLELSSIIATLGTLATGFFGVKFVKVKNKLKQAIKAIKETNDLLEETDKALADNKLEEAEVRSIYKELKEAIAALKILFNIK